jgi:hypothetical protein
MGQTKGLSTSQLWINPRAWVFVIDGGGGVRSTQQQQTAAGSDTAETRALSMKPPLGKTAHDVRNSQYMAQGTDSLENRQAAE